MSLLTSDEPKTWLWTADEFYDLFEKGYFHDERVELIEGEIKTMSPQGNLHALTIDRAAETLRAAFGTAYWVRVQATFDILPKSVVEPDIGVIEGHRDQHNDNDNPTTAVLFVEASLTTLQFDRTTKGSLYAKVRIEDYWIINIKDRQLEVHRRPQADASQPFGFGYGDFQVFDEHATVSPLAKPNAKIDVADLLP